MATHIKTLGTTANNSIANGIAWVPGFNSGIQQNATVNDMATLSLAIRSDDALQKFKPGSLSDNGLLFLPGGRSPGGIQLLPGDWLGVDTLGWPIVVSAYSIANGLWVHS